MLFKVTASSLQKLGPARAHLIYDYPSACITHAIHHQANEIRVIGFDSLASESRSELDLNRAKSSLVGHRACKHRHKVLTMV